jgi:pyruvate,orthophosphate dikinase
MSSKRVYLFTEGDAGMKDLLGGKGANLAEMTNIGLPVPPGFTITTEACVETLRTRRMPKGLMDDVWSALAHVEDELGRKFGDPENLLLLSVRSGSKFSMPGMMDTILNLGLTPVTVEALARASGDERFAYDAYRRFLMMFSDVVLGVPKQTFEERFEALKARLGAKVDTAVPASELKTLCEQFREHVRSSRGGPFPDDPRVQLEMAIDAVFMSWNNDRARIYRKREGIPDDLGTACNIQAMVFGNMGDDCGTGVAFTRDVATGENLLYGEFLMNAQGEDVVAGVRTPMKIARLRDIMPDVHKQFQEICHTLEQHYRDTMDVEFTIERGRLFMLQARVGKRTGPAAVRIAVEMADEGLITKEEALMRVEPDRLNELLHPRIDTTKLGPEDQPVAAGLGASPGAASGIAVFDSHRAEQMAKDKRGAMILVRRETNPDDIRGMLVVKGVLTQRGGMTSHAAVVARGFGVPCVAGCEELDVDEEAATLTVAGKAVKEGDWITIDGSHGTVYVGQVPTVPPEVTGHLATLLGWADEARKLGVRTNADNPKDAGRAVEFGAEGIGLCRTEHMFFEDRLPVMQEMILAEDEPHRRAALDKLLPFQREDFVGIFRVMAGKPVTVRLLDPPLHEFLPEHDELLEAVTSLRIKQPGSPELAEKERLLDKVETMREVNPMLGLRGVRLSVVFPEIVEMQVTAILEAAIQVKREGHEVFPEIMIPLVGHVNELKLIREKLEAVAKEVLARHEADLPYLFGTMIEVPRAALTADEIARHADFFSFGTNDLTQMTFGFSRDDAEGKFLDEYVEHDILPKNPFAVLDETGVGKLVKLAHDLGREANPRIKMGICGEHGGDPTSIDFCHRVGLNYVSCSPFRVPIARLAAAQAAVRDRVAVSSSV